MNQLACKEVGCPDVEVVMTLLRKKPREKLMFKVYKAAADMTNDEVEEWVNWVSQRWAEVEAQMGGTSSS